MQPGTRGDGLRLQLTGADVISIRVVGTLPGVVVLAAGGRNGTGAGRLIATPTARLAWQAPGSPLAGAAVSCGVDGDYLLEDGADPSCWLRIRAYNQYLPTTGECRVYLADRYNELGPADVTATSAAAGAITTTQYTLANATPTDIARVQLWLDGATTGLAISNDNVSYYAPTSQGDANVLSWPAIAAGASVNLWTRRTIVAGAASSPKILNTLRLAWDGV